MKDTIIILGAGLMQGPIIKIAKELGFFTAVLDGSKDAPCVSLADSFEQIDLKAKEEIESFARRLQGKSGRLGIMTAGTDFSASVAWTAERLGLPGIPYEAALNASDKSRMRECFRKARLPSPEFIVVTKENLEKLENLELFKEKGSGFREQEAGHIINTDSKPQPRSQLPTPNSPAPHSSFLIPNSSLVVKPVDNMGSRGCRRVGNFKELREAAKTAIAYSRSGRAIIENYMDGPEFSVDAIVYKDKITICGLADRHIFFPPYFIEMGHTMPTQIEKPLQEAMLETFCRGVRALGIAGNENIGAAKGDIKLVSGSNGGFEPMIGEIAARLSGGYMSGWTYPYSSGAQPVKAAILMAMGREPEGLLPEKSWTCAERAFISIPGTVKKIIRNEKSEMTNVNDIFFRIKEGDKVDFPVNNVTKCGNVIASAPDRETAVAAAETAAKSILIHLDTSDLSTKEFLTAAQRHRIEKKDSKPSVFPPDAYELTEEMYDTLRHLPEPLCLRAAVRLNFQNFPKDYMGRSIEESLQAVLQLAPKNAENMVLGQLFWKALARGGYQGALYYIENRLENEKGNKTLS